MSDIKKKFRDFFGDSSKNEKNTGEAEKSENIAEYPDEIVEEKSAESEASSDDSDIADNESSENDSGDIEHDAKNYFNNTYQNSIDDRIKSIRENALNTYAKDDDETEGVDDSVSSDSGDEDVKLADFDEASDKSEELPDEDNVGVENADDAVDETPDADYENANEQDSSSHSYDMTQLLRILKKNDDSDDYDEDDDETAGKKSRKKKRKTDVTDESDIVENDLLVEDEPNEYHHDFEYNDSLQSADLFKSFRKSALVSSISVILTLVFSLLCLWIESGHGAGLPFAEKMRPEYFGRVYAMVSLQMLTFCVMFNLDGFARGIRKLSLRKAAPEAVAVISVCVCIVHTVYTAITSYNSINYKTFCFAGCFITLLLSLNTFVKAYTRFKSFTMVLSKKPKLTTVKLDALSEENAVFAKYLSEESDILSVSKAENISSFAKNSYTVPKAVSGCNVLVYLVLILSIVAAVAKLVLFNSGVYEAVTNGVAVFMFSAPVTFLLAVSLPYFITSTRVAKLRNSIIGEAACDTFENAGVISFDDTEVFPPKTVKVTSIKTYNDNRIDKVIVYMAKIFEKLGGPLSHVFSSSVQGGVGDTSGVMVLESSKEGVHLTVDDEDILVGNGNYLRLFDIDVPVDESDESETRSLTSIIYLVSGGQLAAKFYIKYMLNRKFETVLNGLYDAGVCCGVRTNDPGVDNRLIEANLKSANYPISVIHKPVKDIGRTEERSDGALIGLSSIHNYLRSFIMLDKLRGTYRTNTVFSILGTVVGLAVSMVLVFMGIEIKMWTLILFYIFWMIPQFLLSFFRK